MAEQLYDARTGERVNAAFTLKNADPEALKPIRDELGRLLVLVQQAQIDVQKLGDALTGICLTLEEQLDVKLLDPEQGNQSD